LYFFQLQALQMFDLYNSEWWIKLIICGDSDAESDAEMLTGLIN